MDAHHADTLVVPAPAKVNLFLHVTGRRSDGYHTLESLFALVDFADTLSLSVREDGAISRTNDVHGVPPVALAIQAGVGLSTSSDADVARRLLALPAMP